MSERSKGQVGTLPSYDLTTIEPPKSVPREQRLPASLAHVAAAIAKVEAPVWPSFDTMKAFWRDADFVGYRPEDRELRHSEWARARNALALAPEVAPLEAAFEACAAAMSHRDAGQVRKQIGNLFAAYRTDRVPNLTDIMDTTLHDVLDMDFSPIEVGIACRSLRRSLKYLPAVAEVLEACTAARKQLADRRKTLDQLLVMIERVREVAALPEPPPPPPTAWELEQRRTREAWKDGDEIPF